MRLKTFACRYLARPTLGIAAGVVLFGCGAPSPGGGGGGPSPMPSASTAPKPIMTPSIPGPPFISGVPGQAGTGPLIQPKATPAPGGGPTSYPEGTVFATGRVTVSILPGGRFSPDHVYLRPGTVTTIVNRDRVAHTFDGFNGATATSGPIAPGGSSDHQWEHPGTWTFHDSTIANSPVFTVTDVPGD